MFAAHTALQVVPKASLHILKAVVAAEVTHVQLGDIAGDLVAKSETSDEMKKMAQL